MAILTLTEVCENCDQRTCPNCGTCGTIEPFGTWTVSLPNAASVRASVWGRAN